MSGIGSWSSFFRKAVIFALPSVIFVSSLVASQSAARIKGEISDGERVALTGNVRPSLVYAKDQGPVNGSLALSQMTMHFAMSASQKADAIQLLRLQQTRGSSQYHKWLTPEQYADRFGLNSKDMEKVQAWLETQGFSNVQPARGRSFITFSGTAAQAQMAFNTTIHSYVLNGVSHYANSTEPQLPRALNGMVESIRGLHDFHPKPHAHPRLTSTATGNHFLTPADWATIYDVNALYNSGYDGTGHSIAVVGQTSLILSDIETFQTNAGLTVKDPTIIYTTSSHPPVQVNSGDLGESDLDLEWAGGIAKGATIIFVTDFSDVTNSETYAVDNNVADVLSITYGDCEADVGQAEMNALNTLFLQASTQGMTVVAASGDQGAADCDSSTASISTQGLAVDVPGVSPYVTAMGGTEFAEGSTTGGTTYWSATNSSSNESALSYIPETSWNDSATDGVLSASGGGASTFNTKPTWQTGTGVPNDNARDVPDLAVSASADHDGYITCSDGSCVTGFRAASTPASCSAQNLPSPCGTFNVTGGTSAAAPVFAALVAILDQKNQARQGNINQNLYTLASISTTAFHDITTGNNIVACQGGTLGCSSTVNNIAGTLGYSAGVGYDQVTGLGSIDAYNMIEQWNDHFTLTSNPTSLTINPGSTGTATFTVTPFNSFTGTVTFACTISSSITATTCSIPATVTNGSGTATLTVTVGSTAGTPWWKKIPIFPGLPPAEQRGIVFALSALLLAGSAYLVTKQRKLQIVGFAFTVLLVVGVTSCGSSSSSSTTTTTSSTSSGSSSSTAESGIVTVTATSGSLVSNATVAVTIP